MMPFKKVGSYTYNREGDIQILYQISHKCTPISMHVLMGKQNRGHIGSNEIQTHPGSIIQDCIIVAMNRTPKINASAPF